MPLRISGVYQPLVDIIIPIFDVDAYLQRCLTSLARQDYRPFRVLMIDDGSTDLSGPMAQHFAETDNRFIYHRKNNGGAGSARNYGIERVEGDLVLFVDPDDWVEPDFVSSMVSAIGRDHDLGMCDFAGGLPDGRVMWERRVSHGDLTDIFAHVIHSMTEVFVWNKIYRTNAFRREDRFGNSTYEDFGLVPSFVGRARSIGFVAGVKYHYLVRPNSAMYKQSHDGGELTNFDILSAFATLKSHADQFLDKRWAYYFDFNVPRHIFTFRVGNLQAIKSTIPRATAMRAFSAALNKAAPRWAETTAVKHWIGEGGGLRYRAARRLMINAYRTERMAALLAYMALQRRFAGSRPVRDF